MVRRLVIFSSAVGLSHGQVLDAEEYMLLQVQQKAHAQGQSDTNADAELECARHPDRCKPTTTTTNEASCVDYVCDAGYTKIRGAQNIGCGGGQCAQDQCCRKVTTTTTTTPTFGEVSVKPPPTTTTTKEAVCADYVCDAGYTKVRGAQNIGCGSGQCTQNQCCQKVTTTTTTTKEALCADHNCGSGFVNPAAAKKTRNVGCGSGQCTQGQCCKSQASCAGYKCKEGFFSFNDKVCVGWSLIGGQTKCDHEQCCKKEATCKNYQCPRGYERFNESPCRGKSECDRQSCCRKITTTTTTQPLPAKNCELPRDESKICHFWGDPHFTHTFTDSANNGRCSAYGESCRDTKCCKEPGQACFEKDQWWASCRDTAGPKACIPGTTHFDDGPKYRHLKWNCNKLGATNENGVAAFKNKRGGRRNDVQKDQQAFEFHEAGVFRLAKQGSDFEAQAFFCKGPAIRGFGQTSSATGLAMKMGENNTVQMIRNPRTKGSFRGNENQRGYWVNDAIPKSDLVDYYIDGVKTAWHNIGQGGSKRGVTGNEVPMNARGQRVGASNYISQLHSNNDDEAQLSQLPVCVGDTSKKFLVEWSVPAGEKVWSKVFESSVTIIAQKPDAEGICGDTDMQNQIRQGPPQGDYGYLDRNADKYKLSPQEILFTTKQVHELCQTCGMEMKGDLCGGVGAIKQSLHGKTSFAFCTHKGYDHVAAQEACKDMPHDWKTVCEVEQCATESDAKGLLHLERELQEWFNHEGWNRPRAQQRSLANCAAENKDCRSSKCCKTPGMKCYKKDEHWGQCLFPGDCRPNQIRHSDPRQYRTPWSCNILSDSKDTR